MTMHSIHPHCSLAARRIAQAREALATTPVVHDWQRDAMLFELDLIAAKLHDISADHYALESRTA